MKIKIKSDGKCRLVLSPNEVMCAWHLAEFGIDTEEGEGWILRYKKKLIRTKELLRYAHQQMMNNGKNEWVMNSNLQQYERQLLEEYPDA